MLYLAFPTDLRDRYKESQWLVYARMISETSFASEDILVLAEWTVPERTELVEIIYRVRGQGARIIYIGPAQSETDDWKKQLCLMGVYDFAFFANEIILGRVDDLIEHPRTPVDVREYLSLGNEGLAELPPVVDLYEEEAEATPTVASDEDTPRRMSRVHQLFRRKGSQETGAIPDLNLHPIGPRKFIWPNPEPVRVRIIGDAGAGKTFVAWNTAALCNRRELPAAVVEKETLTLTDWAGVTSGVNVYDSPPKKGYRVHLDTRKDEDATANVDLYVVVTWPDRMRMERMLLSLHQKGIESARVLWVVNHHLSELPLPVRLDAPYLVLPYEPRQWAAMRMKIPLVELDPNVAGWLEPLTERISNLFIESATGKRGGDHDVVALGV